MLVKKIKYTDYEGNEREEEFRFNLTKAELMELQLSTTGGLDKMIRKITQSQDGAKIIEYFKKIILMSYGVVSDDGKRFIKSKELSEEFAQTEAYSELFMELASNEEAAVSFVNGIVPKMPEDHKLPEKVTGDVVQMPAK